MSDREYREYEVAKLLESELAGYQAIFDAVSTEARGLLVSPDVVRGAVRQRVAKTGKVRFKKAKPSAFLDDEPNVGYLFATLVEHTGMGAYRSIDSLFYCNVLFGEDVYKKWELTVDVMHLLQREQGVSPEVVRVLNKRAEG